MGTPRRPLLFSFFWLMVSFTLAAFLSGSANAALPGGAQLAMVSVRTRYPISTICLSLPAPTPTPVLSDIPLGIPLFHGDVQKPEIALTFDDGPSSPYTQGVLQILRRYGIHATFFELGGWVQGHPTLAQTVVADGNVIGDHSWSHPNLTALSDAAIRQQLENTIQTIQQVTGARTVLFRPPYGAFNQRVLRIAQSLQLSTILWNVDPRDWSRPGPAWIRDIVFRETHNGSIILMHDGGGDRSQTLAALPSIIEGLRQRGYTFVTIPQLLGQTSHASQAARASSPCKKSPGLPGTPLPLTQPALARDNETIPG